MTFARTLLATAGMLTILTAGASAQSAANQCSQQCAGAISKAYCIQACVDGHKQSRRGARNVESASQPAMSPPGTFQMPNGYDGPGGGGGGRAR